MFGAVFHAIVHCAGPDGLGTCGKYTTLGRAAVDVRHGGWHRSPHPTEPDRTVFTCDPCERVKAVSRVRAALASGKPVAEMTDFERKVAEQILGKELFETLAGRDTPEPFTPRMP